MHVHVAGKQAEGMNTKTLRPRKLINYQQIFWSMDFMDKSKMLILKNIELTKTWLAVLKEKLNPRTWQNHSIAFLDHVAFHL